MTEESKALATQDVIEDAEVVEDPGQESRPKRGMPLWPFLLLIVILGGFAGLGYYGYQYYLGQKAVLEQQADKLAALEAAIQTNDPSAALSGMNNRLDRQDAAIAEQRGLGARVDALQESIQASHDLVNRAQRDWVVAEVEYLIRIANQRLRLMRDYNGAVAALESADQRLHELADPALIPVREILADDIRTLKDFNKPDLIGIALRLDRLISHLKPLPLNVPALDQPPEDRTAEASEADTQDFAGLMSEAWRRLNERVTVRRYEEGVESLPDEESELMMNQLLRLRLEAARVNVLRQDDHDFHQQLDSALDILDKFYRPEQAAKLREEIVALNEINLRPALPDITRSLESLHSRSVIQEADQ